MIAISIGNGSGDGPGSERGLEYDTTSGKYAQFVETEVLPLVEKQTVNQQTLPEALEYVWQGYPIAGPE